MSRKFNTNIDGLKTAEIQNFRAHNLAAPPTTPGVGQFWFNTATAVLQAYDGVANRTIATLSNKLHEFALATANVDLNSNRLINVTDPVNPQDAATKAYADNIAQGLDAKASARAASTANVNIASAPAAIDGITLVNGDRVLLKDQTAPAENGIRIFTAPGATLLRASDMNTWVEVPNAYVWVEEGTQQDTGWVVTSNTGGTLDTTAITWVQFASAGVILAGAGLVKTGVTIDAVAASGSGLVMNADNIDTDPVNGIPVNRGGTGAITAAGAKTNLGFMTRFASTIGDGSTTAIVVTHNLGTRDVVVSVHDAASFDEVEVDVQKTSTNTVTLTFLVAPATNAYRATVIG